MNCVQKQKKKVLKEEWSLIRIVFHKGIHCIKLSEVSAYQIKMSVKSRTYNLPFHPPQSRASLSWPFHMWHHWKSQQWSWVCWCQWSPLVVFWPASEGYGSHACRCCTRHRTEPGPWKQYRCFNYSPSYKTWEMGTDIKSITITHENRETLET